MSKSNLPVLPEHDDEINGQRLYDASSMLRYAEEAVRQALADAAATLEVLAQEAFERPGVAGTVHMAYHQAIATILGNPPETRDG